MSQLLHHHTKYKEIHGVDEIRMMDRREHKLLHNRLRREGKCNISAEKLHKISNQANQRTEHTKNIKRDYKTENIERINFHETLLPYIQLHEIIIYNSNTGTVSYSARFEGHAGVRLPII